MPSFRSRKDGTHYPITRRRHIGTYVTQNDEPWEFRRNRITQQPVLQSTNRDIRGEKVLDNFIRRNRENFSDFSYLMKWSTIPQLHGEGFILYVEAWGDACVTITGTRLTREQAFSHVRLHETWGNEIKTVWFPPASGATEGVSVSIFDLSTLPHVQQMAVIERAKRERRNRR